MACLAHSVCSGTSRVLLKNCPAWSWQSSAVSFVFCLSDLYSILSAVEEENFLAQGLTFTTKKVKLHVEFL